MNIPEKLSKLYPVAKAACDEATENYPGKDIEELKPLGIPASLESMFWLGFMEGDKDAEHKFRKKIQKVLDEY